MYTLFKESTCLTLLALLLTSVVLADFPYDPKPCKFNDKKCFIERVNFFVSTKYAGYKALNLPKIDPFDFPTVQVKKDLSSSIHIDMQLKNNIIKGLKDAQLVEMSGFGPELTQQNEMTFKVKQLQMQGKHTVKGRFIFFSVSGSGNYQFVADDVTLTMRFKGTPQQRQGSTYMTIENISADIDAKHVTYKFDNLFNGSKFLGEKIVSYINQNWLSIWQEIRLNLAQDLQPTIKNLLNQVFATHPYKKFFAD